MAERPSSTALAAATVPPVDESDRLTEASDHGNPTLLFSLTLILPSTYLATYCGQCVVVSSATLTSGDGWNPARREGASSLCSPSLTRRYFAIGNRWFGGRGTSYRSL
eukprot:scaffold108534_cov26-Tisochrysis_lutea.AAC.2